MVAKFLITWCKGWCIHLIIGAIVIIAPFKLIFCNDKVDPHSIQLKHIEAIGGFKNIENVKSLYKETNGFISIGAISWSSKTWLSGTQKYRTETYYPNDTIIYGYNGIHEWEVIKGQVKIIEDKTRLKYDSLLAKREYLNKNSEYFKVKYEGCNEIDDIPCHIISIENNIVDIKQVNYYDTLNYYLVRTDWFKPNLNSIIRYTDFRELNNVIYSFAQTAKIGPEGATALEVIVRKEINIDIDENIFNPPISGSN